MKHLRIFETEQQRTSVLSSATYSILHKLVGQSGITLTIASGPEPGPVTTDNIILKFVTTQPNQSINFINGSSGGLVYDGSCFSCMIKDGDTISENFWSQNISFEDAGEHIVELVFKNDFDGNLPGQCLTGCMCTEAIIGNSVTNIGARAFQDCSGLTFVTIPNSVTSIDTRAFQGCSGLTSVTIPSSVTSIGEAAFRNCSGLTSVTIPDSVTSIGNSAFAGCSGLTSVTIGGSLTNIGNYTFSDCSGLTSVTIPDSVTKIGTQTFSRCSSLTSVTIGGSVTNIGGYVFMDCYGLTSITCNAINPPTLSSSAFGNANNCPIYVPAASVDAYKAASSWSTYASRIQAIQ